jgi:TnpA family transposase
MTVLGKVTLTKPDGSMPPATTMSVRDTNPQNIIERVANMSRHHATYAYIISFSEVDDIGYHLAYPDVYVHDGTSSILLTDVEP